MEAGRAWDGDKAEPDTKHTDREKYNLPLAGEPGSRQREKYNHAYRQKVCPDQPGNCGIGKEAQMLIEIKRIASEYPETRVALLPLIIKAAAAKAGSTGKTAYFTVSIPPVKGGEKATQWHGPKTLTRGAFKKKTEGDAWAKKNIPGHKYKIIEVDEPKGGKYASQSWMVEVTAPERFSVQVERAAEGLGGELDDEGDDGKGYMMSVIFDDEDSAKEFVGLMSRRWTVQRPKRVASEKTLLNGLKRIASEHPETRAALVPLIKAASISHRFDGHVRKLSAYR